MPRPCAVESHARRYKNARARALSLPDATALRRGVSRSLLQKRARSRSLSSRCHGLAPWSLTLAATNAHSLRITAPQLDVLTNLRASTKSLIDTIAVCEVEFGTLVR